MSIMQPLFKMCFSLLPRSTAHTIDAICRYRQRLDRNARRQESVQKQPHILQLDFLKYTYVATK